MIDVILLTILAVATAVERLVEVVKPLYLRIKNFFTKKADGELTKTEKITMTIIIGPVLTIVAGALGVREVSPLDGVSPIAQWIMIGLFASFGSNIIHPVIGLIAAFKEAAEGLKNKE